MKYFSTAKQWRDWLVTNHVLKTELVVEFHRKKPGGTAMTWSESVDEALCFGWIDAVRKSIDAESYSIRFTKRRTGSIWSQVNIKKAEELIRLGRMQPAGLKAFEKRSESKSAVYSFEQKQVELDPVSVNTFQKTPDAWAFFQSQPAGYRKKVSWWVITARQPETRSRRLDRLIDYSRRRERL